MKKSIPHLLICLALFLLVPRAHAQTTVFFESFENTNSFATNWVSAPFFEDDEETALWGVVDRAFGGSGELPRTGTNKLYCAATRLDGSPGYYGTSNFPRYQDNIWNTLSREVDLQNYKSATLTFWYKAKIFPGLETEDDYIFPEFDLDYMTVYVNDDAPFTTYDLTEVVNGWTKVTINLDEYAGTVCTLRFEFESDFAGQEDEETPGEGIYIDDILVTGYTAYRADYNQDGKIDFLFHNLNDGRLAIWHMASYTQMGQSVLVRGGLAVPSVWRVAAQSDFDNNGSADILFHHGDGRLNVWFMDGSNFIKNALIKTIAPGWRAGATADFNQDGHQDLVWQHTDRRVAVWYMNGTNFIGSGLINKPLPAADVNIVGAGDFNYDGRRDLLLQKKLNGSITARQLLGTTWVKDTVLTLSPGLSFSVDWKVAGTHDLNGDGDPDLLMRHSNGQLAAWILDGTKIIQQTLIRNAGVQWQNAGHR